MDDSKYSPLIAKSKQQIRKGIDEVLGHLGFDLVRKPSAGAALPLDFDAETVDIVKAIRGLTLTSPERVFALCEAVRYVIRADIDGAFAECGVWRGGSSLAVVRTLISLGVTNRDVYLYDTFSYMPTPGPEDIDIRGVSASEGHAALDGGEASDPTFEFLPFEEVRSTFLRTGYPEERLHFVQGLVEDTIPQHAPKVIALLRLDTDYYQSTKHELAHLGPRIPVGGVLLIDDYGHFQGCKKAVDEYVAELAESDRHLLLNRIDYSGRITLMPPKSTRKRTGTSTALASPNPPAESRSSRRRSTSVSAQSEE